MIAAVFALEFESSGFRATHSPRLCVSIWTLGVTGCRSASALGRLIERSRPEVIVSAGLSGALVPDLELGNIVIGENYSAPHLIKAIPQLQNILIGKIATAREILETSTAKRELRESTGAVAGDLESAHLYDLCRSAGIPMMSVRSISDTLEQEMPLPGSILIDAHTGRPDPAQIFRFLFRNPSKAPQFAKLVNSARSAQHSLALALNEILPLLLKSTPRQ